MIDSAYMARVALSELRTHLRREVTNLAASVRRGLAVRTERAWLDETEAREVARAELHPDHDEDAPDWAASPRRRFHFGIRKRIGKLRVARARLETLLALEEKAKAA